MEHAIPERQYVRLHRIGVALCVLTFGLIVWGAHVNTTRSGMAFPDWPTSNLAPMVTYAPSQWLMQTDKFWEHGHRLLASLVGLVTVVLGIAVYRAVPVKARPKRSIMAVLGVVCAIIVSAVIGFNDMPFGIMEGFMVCLAIVLATFLVVAMRNRRESRLMWLALAAFVCVCLQGTFGGLTVRYNLPDWTSTTHGMLAQLYFMIILGTTMLTSRRWRVTPPSSVDVSRGVSWIIRLTFALTFLQFFLGALTRHTDAWGVSVSFPQWSEAGFFPDAALLQYAQVVIHLAHRTFAYAVALIILVQWVLVVRSGATLRAIRTTSSIAAALVGIQIYLGAMVLWTARGELATTLHVMVGVILLMLATVTMFNAQRYYEFGGRIQAPHGSLAHMESR